MAKSLSAFLAQNAKKVDNRSFPLSKRFTDENGEAMEWEITCITAAENQKLRRDSLRSIPVNGKRGQYTQELDTAQLVGIMLTPAEFDDLVIAITELCGFTTDGEIVDEAKN